MDYILSHFKSRPWFLVVVIALIIAPIYGQFLSNPLVFDDGTFFNGLAHPEFLGKVFSLEWRWLPYATFEWTRVLLGSDMAWFRAGNLALHIANSAVLFLFMLKLFNVVLPVEKTAAAERASGAGSTRFAFFGALIFGLNPAAVYAVAYLIQRSIVMATLFTLIMLYLFLEGVTRRSRWWLMASVIAYLLAVFSKEHAIMAPAVAFALLFLVRQPTRDLFKQVWPIFVLYGLVAVFLIFEIKSSQLLGQAYEPRSIDMLAMLAKQNLGFDPNLAYPLSAFTQSFLFFKYLLIWIIPSPAWMSIDMHENFAVRFWSWPHMAGAICFFIYPLLAIRLLIQRGANGLLGFALLYPWLMFATELSVVRIQEGFVIYRSYLWMPGIFVGLPFLFRKVSAQRTTVLLAALAFVMIPLTWDRLTTFSHPLKLWNDAARLVEGKTNRPGTERIYYSRGIMFCNLGWYVEAIQDHSRAVAINPEFSYGYHERGANYLLMQKYPQAIEDFNRAILLNPGYWRPYLGRALTYEALDNQQAASQDYQTLCMMGLAEKCVQAKLLSSGR